jgi:hypothetical protein
LPPAKVPIHETDVSPKGSVRLQIFVARSCGKQLGPIAFVGWDQAIDRKRKIPCARRPPHLIMTLNSLIELFGDGSWKRRSIETELQDAIGV